MGFKPSRADPDTWMKYSKDGSHYEYIAVYIDDLAIYMEDLKSFCDKIITLDVDTPGMKITLQTH